MTTLRAPRRAYRDPEDRFLGGVASGLAEHLGLGAFQLRVGFLLLSLVGGFGALVYAGLWAMLPLRPEGLVPAAPPGIEAATRQGKRSSARGRGARDVTLVVSLLLVFIGLVALLQTLGLGVSQQVWWPLSVGSVGIVLLWWQSDQSSRAAWLTTSHGWKTWLRTAAGVLLVISALALVLLQSGVRGAIGTALAAVALALFGTALVVGPWLLRTERALRAERVERIRSQERADVAAHLHDSVLQTLALIQRKADDPQAVARLARTQERELRGWLFATPDEGELMLGTALRAAAAQVEDAHAVPVEVVVVGDAAVGETYPPLVAATREALLNAARHSGADRVDLYAEIEPSAAEVFVRDRGRGFDLTTVAGDRAGVRGSIIGRMQRYGGTADVRSAPGEGTEVRLRMTVGGGSGPTNTDTNGSQG